MVLFVCGLPNPDMVSIKVRGGKEKCGWCRMDDDCRKGTKNAPVDGVVDSIAER